MKWEFSDLILGIFLTHVKSEKKSRFQYIITLEVNNI